MDTVRTALKCADCKKILNKPVTLSCGRNVCLKHVVNYPNERYFCQSCGVCHFIQPGESLKVNEALDTLTKINLVNLDLGIEHTKASNNCSQLEDLIRQIESLHNDPVYFINQIAAKLKNETELIREQYKLLIDEKANEIIADIDNFELQCKANLNSNAIQTSIKQMEPIVNSLKLDLTKWKNILNDFSSGEILFKTTKLLSEKALSMLKSKCQTFRRNLVMNEFSKKVEYLSKFNDIQFCPSKKIKEDLAIEYDLLGQTFNNSLILDLELMPKLFKLCELSPNQEMKLLYRASEDGFSADNFHTKCDNITNTLTIIKSSNGNIFGGYANVAFDKSGSFKSDQNAFIFSLINQSENPLKIKIHSGYQAEAIFCDPNKGPIFGAGSDLEISSNSNLVTNSYSNLFYSYLNSNFTCGTVESQSFLAGSYRFLVSEMEVFQLITSD